MTGHAASTGMTPEHRKSRKSLRYAIGLFARVEAFLHNLPDRQCPQQLLEDIRLFHHTTQSDIASGRLTAGPGDVIDIPPGTEPYLENRLNDSIIVHGPRACGKTRNKDALARHFGLANILDDQDPNELPSGIRCNTLILTNVDLAGRREISGIRVIPYAQAAAAAAIRS